MSNSHSDCCPECQAHTFFWQAGCVDNRSALMKQFAGENASVLQELKAAWRNTLDLLEEKSLEQQMRDLYHDFLQRQTQLQSEGFLLDEMAKVSASFASLQKEEAHQHVSVGVSA